MVQVTEYKKNNQGSLLGFRNKRISIKGNRYYSGKGCIIIWTPQGV